MQLVDFEFPSRYTQQHNNLVELAFPDVTEKVRAMMRAAHIPYDIHGKLAVEARTAQVNGFRVMIGGDMGDEIFMCSS